MGSEMCIRDSPHLRDGPMVLVGWRQPGEWCCSGRTAPLARLPPTHQHHWSIPQMRECSRRRPTSNGGVRTNNLTTFPSTTRRPAKGRGRIQRRLERLEWLCFEDKCNRLDALSCSSTLVSFLTRVQVSCADISPSFSHLMLDNSAGDIKGCLLYTSPSPRDS